MVYEITDADLIIVSMGSIAMQTVVKVLKKLIRQRRPAGNSNTNTYGMPSTRAAMMFFIAVYWIFRLKTLEKRTAILLIIAAFISCCIKFVMIEHTIIQLIAGAVLGTVCGVLVNHFN